MSTLIEMQPAYLLHSRPFRDNSFLLDFLTPDFGRLSAVSRGGRSAGSRSKGLLQPFTPVHISLSGKSDLKTLRNIELRAAGISLRGERLFSAMYMNEIIVRLFQSHEADSGFFDLYERSLLQLAGGSETEPLLRHFELQLLDSMGYGIDFGHEAHSDQPVEENCWYYFQEESGFVRLYEPGAPAESGSPGNTIFPGSDLLSISAGDFTGKSARRTAKAVIRDILNNHLGSKPLGSRALFRKT